VIAVRSSRLPLLCADLTRFPQRKAAPVTSRKNTAAGFTMATKRVSARSWVLRHGRELETVVRLVPCHKNKPCETSRSPHTLRLDNARRGLGVSEPVTALMQTDPKKERTARCGRERAGRLNHDVSSRTRRAGSGWRSTQGNNFTAVQARERQGT